MKTLKTFFLIVAFVLSIGSLFAQGVEPLQPEGAGTLQNPYQIANLANLRWLSETNTAWASGKYFIQTADIDATETVNWNAGAGFSPIGNSSRRFYGNFDGQGYSIGGL